MIVVGSSLPAIIFAVAGFAAADLKGSREDGIKKKGHFCPAINSGLNRAPPRNQRRLLPLEFGNNFGQGLAVSIHGIFHGII
jgi:hypothetical protein